MFAFHSSGNDRSLILVMLLISQHATIFLNFQFPKSRAFYSPTHVPSQKNLEILLQSSVSLTSSETYLKIWQSQSSFLSSAPLPLVFLSILNWRIHFSSFKHLLPLCPRKNLVPFFLSNVSSMSHPILLQLLYPSCLYSAPLQKKTFEYPLVIHQLLIPDGPFPLSHQNSLILPKIQPMSPSPMVSFSLSHQIFF